MFPEFDIVALLLTTPFESRNEAEKTDLIKTCSRPCPELNLYKNETRQNGKKTYVRSFQISWYDRYKWLCGSVHLQKLYCWPCILLSRHKSSFSCYGYLDLKNISRALKIHDESQEHCENSKALKTLEDKFGVTDAIREQSLLKALSMVELCKLCSAKITGFVYRCMVCVDYEFCGECDSQELDLHHNNHYVLRVPAKRPAEEVEQVEFAVRQALASIPSWQLTVFKRKTKKSAKRKKAAKRKHETLENFTVEKENTSDEEVYIKDEWVDEVSETQDTNEFSETEHEPEIKSEFPVKVEPDPLEEENTDALTEETVVAELNQHVRDPQQHNDHEQDEEPPPKKRLVIISSHKKTIEINALVKRNSTVATGTGHSEGESNLNEPDPLEVENTDALTEETVVAELHQHVRDPQHNDHEQDEEPPPKRRLVIISLQHDNDNPNDKTINTTTPIDVKRIPSPSSIKRQRALTDDEITKFFSYGSEEDSEDDDVLDEDEIGLAPVFLPRAARIFMEEDQYEVPSVDANLCYQWPPQPRPVQPEPTPKLQQILPSDWTLDLEPPALHKPSSKFDFEWRSFPQMEQPLRRECFLDINCGPTVTLASPYEAFTAIWDREIMEHIAVETNSYAQQVATAMLTDSTMCPKSRITDWYDTDVNELYVYFAVVQAIGIVVKSRLEEYWTTTRDIFVTPEFSTAMSYNRFLLLCRCLHFSSNYGCNPELMTRSEAKLYKLQPILDHLNDRFPQLYNMSQNVALDKSLIRRKGCFDQFLRSKAASSVGIKSYEVCECKTGYLWRFEVHAGLDISNTTEDSPVPALVLRLLNGLEHKGHTIWMDSNFNSPALARELKVRGFDCAGTLRTDRQFVPAELANLEKSQMAMGQVSACTSGDVDLLVWRDKNRVALISTYHGLATTKCGDKLKPSIVPDYSVCMRGLDRKDQMVAMYPIERWQNCVWYQKLFRRLLNVSVLNAYILYKAQHQTVHREFRKALVNQLLSKHMPPAPLPPGHITSGHVPAQYQFMAGRQHERQRRSCFFCSKRTNAYCKACDVPLCPYTCFEPHHTRLKGSKSSKFDTDSN